MPADVAAAVRTAYDRLGSPVVAVRSSATAEDLGDLSFAGQQDTVLGVRAVDAVLAAVLTCWRSLQGERAVAYRRQHGVAEEAVAMAVVVQRQVPADAAGVAFSLDPVTGRRDAVVVEAVAGLGDRLVSGEAAAVRVRVGRASGTVDPSEPGRLAGLLDSGQVRRLAALVVRAEAALGTDVDVEWCREGNALWLVQARPVTAVGPGDPWNDARTGDLWWTRTNVGEAVPDVMTPATWSVVSVFLAGAMADAALPPHLGWGRVAGRAYVNVSVMASLTAAVGIGEARYRRLAREVFGRLPDDAAIPRVRVTRGRALRALLPLVRHMARETAAVRHLDAVLEGYPARCDQQRTRLAAVDDPAGLARLWTEVVAPDLGRLSLLLSAVTRASGVVFVPTRMWLRRLVGDAAANDLTAGVGGGAGRLASLGLLEGVDQVARGRLDRDGFLRRYGHRGPHELEISRPRPAEDPAWLDAQLASASAPTRTGSDERRAEQERRRQQAWVALRAQHPGPARPLGLLVRAWGAVARRREHARSELVRTFGVVRAWALRAGELTGLGDDVFFLEVPEILRVLQGETLAPRLVADRRAAHQAYARLPPPPALVRGPFDPYAPDRPPAETSPGVPTGPDRVVTGFPGAAGTVEGVVRVLAEADEGEALQPGEVLVTTSTNVGWTPLFPRAAAVVTDVGAPLSHAAIVARELGLPAVVGCGDATARLRTGDRVRVDGAAGTVTVLARGTSW